MSSNIREIVSYLTVDQQVQFIRENYQDYIESDDVEFDILRLLFGILPDGEEILEITYTQEVATVLDYISDFPKELLSIIAFETRDYDSVINFCNTNKSFSTICRDKFFWIQFLRNRGCEGSLIDLTIDELVEVAKTEAYINKPRKHQERKRRYKDLEIENIDVASVIYMWLNLDRIIIPNEHLSQYFIDLSWDLENHENIDQISEDARDFLPHLLIELFTRDQIESHLTADVYFDNILSYLSNRKLDIFRGYQSTINKVYRPYNLIEKIVRYYIRGNIVGDIYWFVNVLDLHKASKKNIEGLLEILSLTGIIEQEQFDEIYETVINYAQTYFPNDLIILNMIGRVVHQRKFEDENNTIFDFLNDRRINGMIKLREKLFDRIEDFLQPYLNKLIIIPSPPHELIRDVDPNIFD